MPRVGTRDAASARSIECALWLAAGLAALTTEGFTPDGSRATWVLSLITVVHGLRVFLAHGAARTTALGCSPSPDPFSSATRAWWPPAHRSPR
jgi:hypothetical protein